MKLYILLTALIFALLTPCALQGAEQSVADTTTGTNIHCSVESSLALMPYPPVGIMPSVGINLRYGKILAKTAYAESGVIKGRTYTKQLNVMMGTYHENNRFRFEYLLGLGYIQERIVYEWSPFPQIWSPSKFHNGLNGIASFRLKYAPKHWFSFGVGLDATISNRYYFWGPAVSLEFGKILNKPKARQTN